MTLRGRDSVPDSLPAKNERLLETETSGVKPADSTTTLHTGCQGVWVVGVGAREGGVGVWGWGARPFISQCRRLYSNLITVRPSLVLRASRKFSAFADTPVRKKQETRANQPTNRRFTSECTELFSRISLEVSLHDNLCTLGLSIVGAGHKPSAYIRPARDLYYVGIRRQSRKTNAGYHSSSTC